MAWITDLEASCREPSAKILLYNNHAAQNDLIALLGCLIGPRRLQLVRLGGHEHAWLGHLRRHVVACLQLNVLRDHCLRVAAKLFHRIVVNTFDTECLRARIQILFTIDFVLEAACTSIQ